MIQDFFHPQYVHVFFVPLFPKCWTARFSPGARSLKKQWPLREKTVHATRVCGRFWRCYGLGPIRSTCFVGIADHWACALWHFWAPIFFSASWQNLTKAKVDVHTLQGLHVFIYSYSQLPLHFCVNAHTFLKTLPYDICSISYLLVSKHGKGKSSINGKFTFSM